MEVIGGLLWLLMFGGLVLLLYWAPSGESWVPSAAPMDPIAAMRESRTERVRIERAAMADWDQRFWREAPTENPMFEQWAARCCASPAEVREKVERILKASPTVTHAEYERVMASVRHWESRQQEYQA